MSVLSVDLAASRYRQTAGAQTNHSIISKKRFIISEKPNYTLFEKDCFGSQKFLSYGGKTVFEHHEAAYHQLDQAEETDALEDIDTLKNEIIAAAKQGVSDYLTGAEKTNEAVKKAVFWRFSQNTLTLLQGEIDKLTSEKLNGRLMLPKESKLNLELKSFENDRHSVRLIGRIEGTFQKLYDPASSEMVDLETPLRVEADIELKITPNRNWGSYWFREGDVRTIAKTSISITEKSS